MVINRKVVGTDLGPVSLASDEELVAIEPSKIEGPATRLTAHQVLLHLAGDGDELGGSGPVRASLANPENAANPELRRYEAVFGRDALYTAEFLSDLHPLLEEETVRYLGSFQAIASDPRRQAEPGKIP